MVGTGLLVLTGLLLSACGGGGDGPTAPNPPPGGGNPPDPPAGRPTLDPTYRPSGFAAAGAVFVHLFEWPWEDVAAECENVLGPAGFRGVQISPPQEHAVVGGYPWWQRYQPVSYTLAESRSGTEAQFRDMVSRCAAAGVEIYVDAVINHMTAGSGTGSAGTEYTKYEYPGLWTQSDFHSPCSVENYLDEANVQDCELLGLADLATGQPQVREKIADYLVSMVEMGVAGFRIDAAKHIQPVELDSILDLANQTATGQGLPRPWYFAEVIDYGGEAVQATDYFGLAYSSGGAADVTEFRYRAVAEKFSGAGGQQVSDLDGFSASAWGLMPDDKSVVFLLNHDTQRDGGANGVDYDDGAAFRAANVWMLAQPYGYPKVFSGYAIRLPADRDLGPPSNGIGGTRPVVCPATLEDARLGEWVCEHRDPAILGMVAFRKAAAGRPVTGWWDNGGDAVAFSRGDRGWVAINLESEPVVVDVATTLDPGLYCDALGPDLGDPSTGQCVGASVEVTSEGRIQLELEAGGLRAIHVNTKVES